LAERAQSSSSRTTTPRVQSLGTAAVSARKAFAWVWSRESLLRLALSFVLAVALWLYITEKQDPGLAQDFPQALPVETVNLGVGLTVITTTIPSVHIRYRADTPGALVTSVNFHPIADLLGMKAGSPHRVPVQVIPDPGLHVVRVSPATVLLTLDRIDDRVIRVSPLLLNPVRSGFALGNIVFRPSEIRVQGPHSIVSQIRGASIPISVSHLTATFDSLYKPVLRDVQGFPVKSSSQLQIYPPQIQVHVPILPLSSSKTLPVLVPVTGQVKAGYRIVSIVTNPQTVTVRGAPTTLSQISSAATAPVLMTARKATFTARTQLRLPKGVSASTSSVAVSLGIQPIKAK
jgi:YbbR domain-containing protein